MMVGCDMSMCVHACLNVFKVTPERCTRDF